MTVSRFLVYRLVGPAMQVGLTLYPETPAPTLNNTSVSGVCVANANTTSGKLPSLNLDPDGSWTSLDDQCCCIEGHELVVLEGFDQCQGIHRLFLCLPNLIILDALFFMINIFSSFLKM